MWILPPPTRKYLGEVHSPPSDLKLPETIHCLLLTSRHGASLLPIISSIDICVILLPSNCLPPVMLKYCRKDSLKKNHQKWQGTSAISAFCPSCSTCSTRTALPTEVSIAKTESSGGSAPRKGYHSTGSYPHITESDSLSNESSAILSDSVFLDTESAVCKVWSSAKQSLSADSTGCEISPANLESSGDRHGAFLDTLSSSRKCFDGTEDPYTVYI